MKLSKLYSSNYFAIIIFFISLVLSFVGFYFKDFFAQTKALGLIGIFIINFVSSATFFVSGPAFLTVVAGGSIYNPILVALISSFGAAFGDLISYLLGFSGKKLAARRMESKTWFKLLNDLFTKYGLLVVFVFALIPNPIFDAIGIFAGLFGIKTFKFFVTVFIGRFLRFIILALIGAKYY